MMTKRLSIALLIATTLLLCTGSPIEEPSKENAKQDEDDTEDAGLAFHKNSKIAVIGGGPAGLFAARQLQRAGYHKVKVFERSSSGPSVVQSATVDNHAVDYTTRYLPNANPEGQGLYPPLQEIIDQYGLGTEFVSSPITYVDVSSSTPVTLPIPHIYADFFLPGGAGASGIAGDLIWGFEVLRLAYAAPGVTGCYTALNVPAGTSFAAWSAAVNKPGFTRLAAFTNDAFLGGPATTQDVCSVLKVRAHFMPGDIAGVLRSFGLTDATPLPISSALRSLLSPTFNPSRKLFTDGYKNFFLTLIDQEDLDVELGANVVSVKRKNSQHIEVELENGDREEFDKVIVATRPAQALQFLQDSLSMKTLLQQAVSSPIHVHAFQTTSTASAYPATGPKQFSAILYPFSALLASSTMPQYAFAVNKEHDDSSLVIAIGYANSDGSTADEELRAQQAISSLGYTPTNSVFGVVAPYPVVVPASATANGWHAQAAQLQGENDYYFVGEAFSGFGVPSVLEETTRVIAMHFL